MVDQDGYKGCWEAILIFKNVPILFLFSAIISYFIPIFSVPYFLFSYFLSSPCHLTACSWVVLRKGAPRGVTVFMAVLLICCQ